MNRLYGQNFGNKNAFTAFIRERLISCSVKPEQGCDIKTFINKVPFFYDYLIQVIKFLTS